MQPNMNWKLNQLIVDTPLVKVVYESKGVAMYITCADGSIVEHNQFQPSLEGIVAAISLSAEICAGKFFLKTVVKTPVKDEAKMIGHGAGKK